MEGVDTDAILAVLRGYDELDQHTSWQPRPLPVVARAEAVVRSAASEPSLMRSLVQLWVKTHPALGRDRFPIRAFSPAICVGRDVASLPPEVKAALVSVFDGAVGFWDRFVSAMDPWMPDGELQEVVVHYLEPVLASGTPVDEAAWQRKALCQASPRLLDAMIASGAYDARRNRADGLFLARSERALEVLLDEGHAGVNDPRAGPGSVVPLHLAATLGCCRLLLLRGADPKLLLEPRVPLPRAVVLSWVCELVPSFVNVLPVARLLREGRTFDYCKLLVEELRIEIPHELRASTSLETRWALTALGVRVELPEGSKPRLQWFCWRPRAIVHCHFASANRLFRRRCVTALLCLRGLPKDVRNKILILSFATG